VLELYRIAHYGSISLEHYVYFSITVCVWKITKRFI